MLPFALLLLVVSATGLQMVASTTSYPIGTPGTKWGTAENLQWKDSRILKRSYDEHVTAKLMKLTSVSTSCFDVKQYGSLSHDPDRYPLWYAKTKNWCDSKPCVLITGGVHGYETSGVQGAIMFLNSKAAERFSETFNILVAPCVSPWGYETIQRWTANAVDPNRSFNPDGAVVPGRSFNPEAATEESSQLLSLLKSLNVDQWKCHIDLHETTDSDESEFRPAKAARDGITDSQPDAIPDGFYLVSDSTKSQPDFYHAMIDAVRKITHIAPSDNDGKLIGETVIQEGVIAIPSPATLGLCAGSTNAEYATTTEVYPDSPSATAEICNDAQLACITGALEYIMSTTVCNE